jgi:NAD(P)-dependent dehydrogenase (short-subunit alcohol dehydrogenase family)
MAQPRMTDSGVAPSHVGRSRGVQVAGRVAVVTGASRGLGAGLATHFAASGMHLGLCARHRPKLVARTRPTAHDGRVESAEAPICAAVDVADYNALANFADTVIAHFGHIDLWVNNAGLLGPIAPLAEADPSELAAVIDVNVVGVLNGSALFADHVRRRTGTGVLVNLSSGAATKTYWGWAAYCASKAAVDHLTRVVALEEEGNGLRAYSVYPGLVDTDMQAAIRATSESDFPDGPRFRRAAQENQFNSPAWVAEHLLAIAFDQARDHGHEGERGDVVTRVPDQAAAGAAR